MAGGSRARAADGRRVIQNIGAWIFTSCNKMVELWGRKNSCIVGKVGDAKNASPRLAGQALQHIPPCYAQAARCAMHTLPFCGTIHGDCAALLLETKSCHHIGFHNLSDSAKALFSKAQLFNICCISLQKKKKICPIFLQDKCYCQILAEN